jgi:hypothetical protein
MVSAKETKKEWPLPSVETEASGEHMKESFLGWFVELVVPVQNIFLLSWQL